MLTASGPGGINEIQYAALLMMIARHTGYEPGVFSHVVANEQIYDRHIDAAYELLARYAQLSYDENKILFFGDELVKQPMLYLKSNDFYNTTIDDFIMENYSPMKPQLKLELGI